MSIDRPAKSANFATKPSELGEHSPFAPIERLVYKNALYGASQTPLEKLTGITTPSDPHFEHHHAGIPAIVVNRSGGKCVVLHKPAWYCLHTLLSHR